MHHVVAPSPTIYYCSKHSFLSKLSHLRVFYHEEETGKRQCEVSSHGITDGENDKKNLYYSSQGWQDELLNTIYPFASFQQLSPLSSTALTIEFYISALVSPFQMSAPLGQLSLISTFLASAEGLWASVSANVHEHFHLL